MSETILSVKNLHTSFKTDNGEVMAVKSGSFNPDKGKIFGIGGGSGFGKSVMGLSILENSDNNRRVTVGEGFY